MVESDPNVALRVEAMDQVELANYLATRQLAVASLNLNIENYAAKKFLLEQAVSMEKNAVEALRALARLVVQDGAGDQNLTAAKRTTLLIKSRQDVFLARQHFLYVKSKSV